MFSVYLACTLKQTYNLQECAALPLAALDHRWRGMWYPLILSIFMAREDYKKCLLFMETQIYTYFLDAIASLGLTYESNLYPII